jgi:hypothetical protein
VRAKVRSERVDDELSATEAQINIASAYAIFAREDPHLQLRNLGHIDFLP